MQSLALILGFIALASAAPNDQYHQYEAPPYVVMPQASPDFEERFYPGGSLWACSTDGVAQGNALFDVLAGYIFGENEEGMSIPMTVPVRNKVDDTGRTMCFYIGPDYQENPPTPIDQSIFFETASDMTVFTRNFNDGFPTPAGWAEEVLDLQADVSAAGFSYETDYYYECTYDSPMHLSNRRNEVWLIQTTA